MRLIDADELCNELSTVCDDRYDRTVEWCIGILRQAPTIDAVEVVRCENCKHCMITDYFTSADEKYVTLYHCKLNDNVLKTNDDYCSYGERRDESEVKE